MREDSVFEYLAAAAAATIQALSTINGIILTGSVQLPIHSLKEQKVAPVRELIVLVSIGIVHTIAKVCVPKVFIPVPEPKATEVI